VLYKNAGSARQVCTEALIHTAHSLGICTVDSWLGKKPKKLQAQRCGVWWGFVLGFFVSFFFTFGL